MKMTKAMRAFSAVIAIPAVLALGAWSVHEASASCSMHFNNAFDAWDTNSAGSFGTLQTPQPDVLVNYTSAGQTPWTLYGSETPGNSENLATQGVTPGSRTISVGGPSSTTFTITGSLDNIGLDGIYQLSCWDGSYWACSGSHDIDILKP